MEKVLDVNEQPYDAAFSKVCMDESPKQIVDYEIQTALNGKRREDSEYVRLGVAELFVAFEPLVGYRKMTVEDDHKTFTWVNLHGFANGRAIPPSQGR